MNLPLNTKIVAVIKENTREKAIEELLKLNTIHKQSKDTKIIQEAILYLMEQQHDWENVKLFAKQWKRIQWSQGFIIRMKKRINEDSPSQQKDIWIQMDRLFSIYWDNISPKKINRNYSQPQQKPIQKVNNELHSRLSFNKNIKNNGSTAKNDNIHGVHHQEEHKDIHQTSNKNALQKIKFNKYVPSKQQEKQQVPILKNLESRKKIVVSPIKPAIQKKAIKIKYSGSKQIKPQQDQFSFSIKKQRNIEAKHDNLMQTVTKISDQSFNSFPLLKEQQKANVNIKNKIPSTPGPNIGFTQFTFNYPQKAENKILKQTQQRLFTRQQQSLIDFSIPRNNYYQDLLNKLEISNFRYFDNKFSQMIAQFQ